MAKLTAERIDDLQNAAYLMTVLIMQVQPRINEGKTFDILVDYFVNGAGESEAKAAGQEIRATVEKKKLLS